MRITLAVLQLLLSFSFAKPPSLTDGTEVGNGGFVITCDDETILFYDYYNMSSSFGLKLPPTDPNLKPEELFWQATDIAKKIVLNYSKIDPYGAADLKKKLDYFWENSAVKSEGQPFVQINPPVLKPLPENCSLKQVISFLKINYPPYSQKYVIDMDLFLKLTVKEMAAALLHEILYHETFYQKDWLNVYPNVVSFNSFLLSIPNLLIASHDDVLLWQSKNVKMRFDNKFLQSYYADYPIRCFNSSKTLDYCSLTFYPSGKIKTAFLVPTSYKSSQTTYPIFIEEFAEFSENGRLLSADILNDYEVSINGEKQICTKKLFFDEKGKIVRCL